MALIKQIETPSGVVAEYHHISKSFFDHIHIDTFLNQEKRQANANTLADEWIELPDEVKDAVLTVIYNHLKTLPKWEGAIDG